MLIFNSVTFFFSPSKFLHAALKIMCQLKLVHQIRAKLRAAEPSLRRFQSRLSCVRSAEPRSRLRSGRGSE